jgi:hypothetical protein
MVEESVDRPYGVQPAEEPDIPLTWQQNKNMSALHPSSINKRGSNCILLCSLAVFLTAEARRKIFAF